jgi:dihydroflavonol-4-reductase
MIVVTGATGHIGNVLLRELLSRGETVRAMVPSWEDRTPLDGLEVEIVDGDVREVSSLMRAFEGGDLVYHLAGIVAITAGKKDLLHEVNVEGTRNVVQVCLKRGVRRLVYTSSIHAIIEPPPGTVIDESFPFDPERTIGDYARSKSLATLEVLKGVEAGLDAVVVCPTGVIGPYDYAPSEMGQLMLQVARGKLKAYIDGAYDFVDVRDVAQGLILAAERGRTGEAYILSGDRIGVRDLMGLIEDATGGKAPSLKVPFALARVAAKFTPLYYRLVNSKPLFTEYSVHVLAGDCHTTCEKARDELGYSPRPLKRSVRDTIRWFKEQGTLQTASSSTKNQRS